MEMFIKLDRDEITKTLPYAVICETRSSSRWDTGKRKRLWLAEFDKAERDAAQRIFRLAHNWMLRSGVPDSVVMKPSTIALWQKLGNFCAGL